MDFKCAFQISKIQLQTFVLENMIKFLFLQTIIHQKAGSEWNRTLFYVGYYALMRTGGICLYLLAITYWWDLEGLYTWDVETVFPIPGTPCEYRVAPLYSAQTKPSQSPQTNAELSWQPACQIPENINHFCEITQFCKLISWDLTPVMKLHPQNTKVQSIISTFWILLPFPCHLVWMARNLRILTWH